MEECFIYCATIHMLSMNMIVILTTMTKKIIHSETQRLFTSAMQKFVYVCSSYLSFFSVFTDIHKNSILEVWEGVPIFQRKKSYCVTIKIIF